MAIVRTTLSAAIDANDLDIPLASTTGMLAKDLIAVGSEIMEVKSVVVAGTAAVQRGMGGTASHPHASGTSAEFGQTSDFNAFGQRSTDGPQKGFGLAHRPNKIYAADGAINVEHGWHFLTGTDTAYTLAAPDDDRDDGVELHIIADAATAFVITATDLLRGDSGATDDDVATFGGAIGDQLHLVADGGIWHVITSKNITFT